MAVTDHPQYEEWSQALDRLKEANDRYRSAYIAKSKDVAAAKLDLERAQKAFDDLSDELEDE